MENPTTEMVHLLLTEVSRSKELIEIIN